MDDVGETVGDVAAAPFIQWLHSLSVADAVRQSDWAYPFCETVHVLGLAIVFAPILLFDLRVLGVNRDLNIARFKSLTLPWVWCGFSMNALSGSLMFASDAIELSRNPAFIAKLSLIAVAGANALAFHKRFLPRDMSVEPPGTGAKASAAFSIALWLMIITAGRLMAYIK